MGALLLSLDRGADLDELLTELRQFDLDLLGERGQDDGAKDGI